MYKLKMITLAFAAFSVSSNADLLLTVTDEQGQQTSQCIKSYSFSNNLESLARTTNQGFDNYSYSEVLTNKIYLGKPVYRKLIAVDGVYNRTLGTFPEIETLVYDVVNMSQAGGANTFSGYDINNYYADIRLNANKTLDLHSSFSSAWGYTGEAVIEYTKVSDTNNSVSTSFKSYLHYVPSSSTTEDMESITINDKGIQFADNYVYNSSADTCTAQ